MTQRLHDKADSQEADHTRKTSEHPLLASPNRFKLGVFSANSRTIPVSDDGALSVTWPESLRLALAAEAAGVEAFVPVGRWKGFGGESRYWERSFETLTYAAALSAVTTSISVFATVHVPTLHPVRLAKEVATIDHISNGRFGLNIVAGWNAAEMQMFGSAQRDHDERYRVADEWISLAKRLWQSDTEFDFEGDYFSSPGAISCPKPVQDPYPLIMSAGTSPAGIEFASAHADICFTAGDNPEVAKSMARHIKDESLKRTGRESLVFISPMIVCRDTAQEANEYFDYLLDRTDTAARQRATEALLSGEMRSGTQRTVPMEARDVFKNDLVWIGSPEQIVEKMVSSVDSGIDGALVKFVDYDDGIQRLHSQIIPLAMQAGIRS
jgi:FMNH2-dependent dimethyl sulfone monooxygenase